MIFLRLIIITAVKRNLLMMCYFTNKNNVIVIFMLICGFMSVLSNFMMLPVLAIYAKESFGLNAVQVGFVCGIWPLVLTITTLYSGFIADKFGHWKILILGLCILSISFVLMGLSDLLYIFLFSLILFGIGKSLLSPSIRALLVINCDTHKLNTVLRVNYLCINIACIIGPLLGVVLYTKFNRHGFLFSFATYGILFFIIAVIWFFMPQFKAKSIESNNSKHQRLRFKDALNLLKSKSLFIWLITSTTILFMFGLYESITPLVLVDERAMIQFGYLLSINGIVVVLSQLILLVFKKLISELSATVLGFLFFILGFYLFSIHSFGDMRFIIGTVAFSLGESFLFPQLEILLNKLSPKDLKATYFGVTEIRQVGFFLGPVCGGFIYYSFGSSSMFIGCAAILFSMSVIYLSTFYSLLKTP